jgi:hypothetical protein
MKIKPMPARSTITGRFNRYAYDAGFTVHPQEDGTIKLFDMRMKYYVFRGILYDAVTFVMDELHIQSKFKFKSSPPALRG